MNEDSELQELLESPVVETAREFFAAREYAIAVATYPRDEFIPKGSGKLPFVLDDGETWLAVIYPDGAVKPLPFGYELDDDDAAVDDDTVLMSTIAPSMSSGLLRYVPVREDFQPPDDEAFEMERMLEQALAEDTDDGAFEFDGLEFQMDMFLDAETAEPFTGVATLHWENGTLKKEAHFSKGALNGKMTWWYENGQKELEDNYLDNQRHGKHEKWHANGNRALLMTFEEGVEHGIHKEWYESGQLEAIFPVADGEVHGTVQLWDEDGTKYEDVEFFEGEQVTSTGEEVTGEEVEDLKERIMELVESEEAKAAVEGLIFTVEEAADGDLDQVAEALQEVIDDLEQKLETGRSDIDAKVPLIEATVEGDVKEIRRLLKEGPEPDVGSPGFVYAIVADQPKAFEVYAKHGIDVAKQFDWDNGDGSVFPDVNAFILAAGTGNTWAVKRLLDLGADPNLETSGGQTPFRMAITNGQDEVVDLLFDKIPDVSTPSAGRVLVAAATAENAELVGRCLEAGVPVNATDASGWTALKCAVKDLDHEMAELLLQHGADCNLVDDEGWTPLLNAIENRDLDLVNLLLSNGANPNAAPEIEDDDGNHGFSALMRAAHYGEAEILEALIAAGADLAQTDSGGFMAAHYAASHQNPDCLEILLDSGADINAISEEGQSPTGMFLVGLVGAVQQGDDIDQDGAVMTLDLLIKNGGNWQEAADKIVGNVGEVDITVLDAAKFAVKQEGLNKLSAAIAEVSDTASEGDQESGSVRSDRPRLKRDDPITELYRAAQVLEKYESISHAFPRRDFHPQAIDVFESFLSELEPFDSQNSFSNEIDLITAVLAEIYCDDWDIKKAYRLVAVLLGRNYFPQKRSPTISSFDIFRFIELLSTLSKRLFAASLREEADVTLDYAKNIYRKAELEYAPYIDEPQSILAGEKKLRIILNHPRQAENALALDLISVKKYEQLCKKFGLKKQKLEEKEQLLTAFLEGDQFAELPFDKDINRDLSGSEFIPEIGPVDDKKSANLDADQQAEYWLAFSDKTSLKLVREYTYVRLASYLLSLHAPIDQGLMTTIEKECCLLGQLYEDGERSSAGTLSRISEFRNDLSTLGASSKDEKKAAARIKNLLTKYEWLLSDQL